LGTAILLVNTVTALQERMRQLEKLITVMKRQNKRRFQIMSSSQTSDKKQPIDGAKQISQAKQDRMLADACLSTGLTIKELHARVPESQKMSRRSGKKLSSALAVYEYLWSVPDGKVITIKKTKGALFFKIEDEVKEPQATFLVFDEMESISNGT